PAAARPYPNTGQHEPCMNKHRLQIKTRSRPNLIQTSAVAQRACSLQGNAFSRASPTLSEASVVPVFGMIAEVLHNYVYHLTNVDAFGWADQAQLFPRIGNSGHIATAKCSLGSRVGSAIVVQCLASFKGCVHVL